ncbi:MAG TPA: multicopper oxidase domain-containing protein, partial [Gemmatimonadaceae bacterium]
MRSRLVAPLLLLPFAAFGVTSRGHAVATRVVVPVVERAAINDNRRAAGVLRAGVLTLHLEARLADWHPDGDDAPGATVPALAEEGRAASIPGPLIRVPAGTVVSLTVRNSLAQPLVLRGLGERATASSAVKGDDSMALAPGATRAARFRLDVPGTYYYYGVVNDGAHRTTVDWRIGLDAQLTGAIVVDPAGAPPPNDRIMVFGIWADTVGRTLIHNRRMLATVNGRSWPHTERLAYTVGDTVRWRMINATADFHPMHLHGFYYMVDSRGDGAGDTIYAPARRLRVNTLGMLPGTTATLTWIPERAGNWLFHCHIPEHFAPRGALGMEREAGHAEMGEAHAMNHALEGMNGLVTGVTVKSRPGDVATRDESAGRRTMRLLVRRNAGGLARQPFYEYALAGVSEPPPDSGLHVGPTVVVKRGEPVSITVVNQLDEPTSVHWHGIELESYFDGVAGFSGAGAQISPAVAAGDSFVARFTPPRAGTFIYHTHVSESRQQLAGLAGALVVLEGSTTLDSATDHVVLVTSPPTHEEQLRYV